LVQRNNRALDIIPVVDPRAVTAIDLEAELGKVGAVLDLGVVAGHGLERAEVDVDVLERKCRLDWWRWRGWRDRARC
jgi:hypothetical protein